MDEVSDRFEKLAAFRAKLLELELPAVEVKVFGMARINVHVTCLSRKAAERWLSALSAAIPGCRTSMRETCWEAKKNNGTCLLPTMRNGWFVGAIG